MTTTPCRQQIERVNQSGHPITHAAARSPSRKRQSFGNRFDNVTHIRGGPAASGASFGTSTETPMGLRCHAGSPGVSPATRHRFPRARQKRLRIGIRTDRAAPIPSARGHKSVALVLRRLATATAHRPKRRDHRESPPTSHVRLCRCWQLSVWAAQVRKQNRRSFCARPSGLPARAAAPRWPKPETRKRVPAGQGFCRPFPAEFVCRARPVKSRHRFDQQHVFVVIARLVGDMQNPDVSAGPCPLGIASCRRESLSQQRHKTMLFAGPTSCSRLRQSQT